MYSRSLLEASRATLVEVLLDLEDYRDHLVLGGGWASYFVLSKFGDVDERQGSADVDLVVEPSIVKSELYNKMLSAILRKGFRPYETHGRAVFPYRLYREVPSPVDNKTHLIKIDFITEPPATEKGYASKFVMGQGGVGAVAIGGAGVVLRSNFEHRIRGTLPSGREDSVRFKVADLAGCVTTKVLALKGRCKEKDLYDLTALLRRYPEGLRNVPSDIDSSISALTLKEAVNEIIRRSMEMGLRPMRLPNASNTSKHYGRTRL
jgi:hypothetical protein